MTGKDRRNRRGTCIAPAIPASSSANAGKILGISFSHNASASVVDAATGRIVFCCSEERFTRRKNEWGMPRRTLEYIFRHVVPPAAIGAIAIGESCRLEYATGAFGRTLNLENYAVRDRLIRNKPAALALAGRECLGRLIGLRGDLRRDIETMLRAYGLDAPLRFVEHHEAHAAGAYFTAPFDEALVMTLDGEGDGRCGSVWHGRGPVLSAAHALPDCMSPGLFYKSIASLLGFRVNRDEGKVTGLAARGDPDRFWGALHPFLEVRRDGNDFAVHSPMAAAHIARLSRRSMDFARLARLYAHFHAARSWETLLNAILRDWFRELYQPHFPCDLTRLGEHDKADIAAAAQRLLEETALAWLAHCRVLVPARDIALSGGVFANVSLNRCILEAGHTGRIHVYPPMGDEGLALGAALCAYMSQPGTRAKPPPPGDFFLGPDLAPQAEESPIAPLAERVAGALANGQIVGIARGRAEYGPRALGNRSILAHPGGRGTAPRLNAMLGRSSCMPFAPAVLDSHFNALFPGESAARARETCRSMTVALPVAPAWKDRLPAVVHLDGTARPQVTDTATAPFLHAVVRAFYRKTGLPCVLNTSFNAHGEPIVQTAEEAERTARNAGLDALVLGDSYMELRRLPVEAAATAPCAFPLEPISAVS